MSDIRIFNIKNGIKEIKGNACLIEREIQSLIEHNMSEFFGVRFLKTEWSNEEGRLDSIGIDEDNSPVIFEYKRRENENVINQGLFYLNWLLSHKNDFKMLVLESLGTEIADKIDWTMPKIFCIAHDFNKYDEDAIKQINRKINLIKYSKYGDDFILFEYLNSNKVKPLNDDDNNEKVVAQNKTFSESLEIANPKIVELYNDLKEYLLSLGDDVSDSIQKYYEAYKKIRNFATVRIQKEKILVHLSLNPKDYELNDVVEDYSNKGHYGTGDLRVNVKDNKSLQKAKELALISYQNI